MKKTVLFLLALCCGASFSSAQSTDFQQFLRAFPVSLPQERLKEFFNPAEATDVKAKPLPHKLPYPVLFHEQAVALVPVVQYKTAAGLYLLSILENTSMQAYTQLLVFDSQGKFLSNIEVGNQLFNQTKTTEYAYTSPQIMEKNGKIQLKIYKGKREYITNTDEGTETTYILTEAGIFQQTKARAYSDKIIPN